MLPISTLYRRDGYKAPPWRVLPLLLFSIFLSIGLLAQVQGGQFHLGGSFSFNQNRTSSTQHAFSSVIRPTVGVMLSPRWSAGLSVPFEYVNTSTTLPRYSLGIGPFIRRYVDLKSGFFGIAHLQVENHFDLNKYFVRNYSISAHLVPAISYFFSPRFAFEAAFGSISYSSNRQVAGSSEVKSQNNSIRFYSTPGFSLRYYFPKLTQSPN